MPAGQPENDPCHRGTPGGYIVSRLRAGGRPPAGFLALARLTPQETALLTSTWVRSEACRDWPSLDGHEKLRYLARRWAAIQAAQRRCEPTFPKPLRSLR